ncbi:hypothetical protein AB0E04_03780 [Streptomyces sp. NPDC048251]|uniref:hypothetical protein n=1 Tax=Streptomyces sp. NPDC048251 TaxID=3154501 RepID=UPI003424ABBC
MDITHVAFQGGTKDGTTANYQDLDAESNLLFDAAFEPEELYERTTETLAVDGVDHVVFRIKA